MKLPHLGSGLYAIKAIFHPTLVSQPLCLLGCSVGSWAASSWGAAVVAAAAIVAESAVAVAGRASAADSGTHC